MRVMAASGRTRDTQTVLADNSHCMVSMHCKCFCYVYMFKTQMGIISSNHLPLALLTLPPPLPSTLTRHWGPPLLSLLRQASLRVPLPVEARQVEGTIGG
jgi:hypothetical protein